MPGVITAIIRQIDATVNTMKRIFTMERIFRIFVPVGMVILYPWKYTSRDIPFFAITGSSHDS